MGRQAPRGELAVAGRDRGFDAKARASVNTAATSAYRVAIRDCAGMGNLDVWYARIEAEDLARAGRHAGRFERNVAKARSTDGLKAFAKLTQMVDGARGSRATAADRSDSRTPSRLRSITGSTSS
jgi:hypothetical protein